MMIETPDLGGNGMGVAFMDQVNVDEEIDGVGQFTSSARVRGSFNYALTGTFVATMRLQKSLDNGVTWNNVTAFGATFSFTAPCQESHAEPENGALYRWYCAAYTSGIINCRISQ